MFREGELCPLCCCQGLGCSCGPFQPPLGSCARLFQGALLSQTCKTDDKVHPNVTVGSWQQKGQMAKLGPVWLCTESGVLLPHCGFIILHRQMSQGVLCPGPGPWQGHCFSRQSMVFYPTSPPGTSSDVLEKCSCDVRLELGWPWHPCVDDPDSGTRRNGPESIQCDPFGIRNAELLIYPGLISMALPSLSRPTWVIDPGHYETSRGQIPIL